jgi:threonine dehydrogenase-like Zn-dependent dehydrogenase
VVTADTIPFRLKKAEQIGADLAHAADDKLINALREVNEGRLADLVIVCFEGFIPLAVECVERGGIAVKNNRKTIDGRRDKNDTKDPAVIADLMS